MRSFHLSIRIVLCLVCGTAEAAEWRKFVIPSTGASADIPVSIFNKGIELPDGGVRSSVLYGRSSCRFDDPVCPEPS
jgi:hypothetical protein